MSDTGENYPETAATVDRDGKTAWTNPNSAKVSDNARATCIDWETYSDWLRLTKFGFTIPSGATINGIKVRIEKHTLDAGVIKDSALYLRKTSGQTGDNKASASYWATGDNWITYGSPTDMWGTSLTRDDIVSDDFGIDFSIYFADYYLGGVDCVGVTVYYTAAGWANISKINGITATDISKVNGIAVASISKVNGVAV